MTRNEQIVALLTKTTTVIVFSFLLYFYAIGMAGNGGQFWGFNGLEDPAFVARKNFESEDTRLLQVNLTTMLGRTVIDTPVNIYCDGEPFGEELPARRSIEELVHGPDSVRLATEFAQRYNNIMAFYIASTQNPACQVGISRFRSTVYNRIDSSWVAITMLSIVCVLIVLTIMLWPRQRRHKQQLELIQAKIAKRAAIFAAKQKIRERLEKERILRRILRRVRRDHPKRK